MGLTTSSGGGVRVLALAGDVDAALGAELREAVAEALEDGSTGIVLDVTAVTFLDGAAVAVLTAAQQRCDDAQLPLRVVAGEGPGSPLLYKSGMVSAFTVCTSLDEATAALAGASSGS